MNTETKVGLFVLLGIGVFGFGIMKLSDISFKSSYTLYFVFDDIGNLRDKSMIKMSGVGVGKVRRITLEKGRAKVSAHIDTDIPVYANAQAQIRLTGLVGSQYLDLQPGTPEYPLLKDGETLYGVPLKTMDQLIENISDVIGGKDGEDGVGQNLHATMANLRSITDSLNYAIGRQQRELKDMIANFHQFSKDLKGIAQDVHEVTSVRKKDLDVSLVKLRSILEKVDGMMDKLQNGKGAIGKLLSDEAMAEEVKETVSNIKETSQSAKEVLARFTKMRSYWELQLRSAPQANTFRADGGILLQPREHKYYYLGVHNGGDRKQEFKELGDYEKKNTITAVLGKEYGPLTLELGAIRSSAGIGVKVYPLQPFVDDQSPVRWAKNIELNAQAFDFGRDEIRGRAGREKLFDTPQYNIGARYRLNRFLSVGATLEDIAELKQYNINTRVIFEDKDLSYLFGFVSFAR